MFFACASSPSFFFFFSNLSPDLDRLSFWRLHPRGLDPPPTIFWWRWSQTLIWCILNWSRLRPSLSEGKTLSRPRNVPFLRWEQEHLLEPSPHTCKLRQMVWSDVASSTQLYVYFLQMTCMVEQNLWPYSALVVVSMLAKSVSTSCDMPMTMPYVAIYAALDCKSSMFTLIFLQKSKVWLITLRSCSSTSLINLQSAPSMAACITLKNLKLSMPLWLLPSGVRRMVEVMLLPTFIVMASTAPSFAPMTT